VADVTQDMLDRRAKVRATALLKKQAVDKIPFPFVVIAAYVDHKKRLLQCSESGVLYIASARLKDTFHVTATSDDFVYQGSHVVCSELLVIAHPDNVGRIWVRSDIPATTDNSTPLNAGDSIVFSLDTVKSLHILIEKNTDVAIVNITV